MPRISVRKKPKPDLASKPGNKSMKVRKKVKPVSKPADKKKIVGMVM